MTAYLMMGPSAADKFANAFGPAAGAIVLITAVWWIVLKATRAKRPYPYAFSVFAGLTIALLTFAGVAVIAAILQIALRN